MSFLEQASIKAAAEYEIERAELNARLSLSIHQQLESRAPEYSLVPNNQEVATGYPETIAPLVMDSSRLRCAMCANTDEIVVSTPETLDTACSDDKTICPIPGQLNDEFGLSAKRPHTVACINAGLMTADTKRPYDEAHLCDGLLMFGVKVRNY